MIDDSDGSGRGGCGARNASRVSGDSDGAVPAVPVGEGEGEGEGGRSGQVRGREKKKR